MRNRHNPSFQNTPHKLDPSLSRGVRQSRLANHFDSLGMKSRIFPDFRYSSSVLPVQGAG